MSQPQQTLQFNGQTRHFKTLIVGGGGGGTGPLVYAAQKGLLDTLLDQGLAIVDRQCQMGRGTIGRYVIQSDTAGGTLLECLDSEPAQKVFASVIQSPVRHEVERYRNSSLPLALVGDYMTVLGAALQQAIESNPASAFLPRTDATEVRLMPNGSACVHVVSREGCEADSPVVDEGDIVADKLVLSVGGRQDHTRDLASPIVPGLTCGMFRDKVMFTDDAQQTTGVAEIERRLRERIAKTGNKKVVIIGASHSALSTAWMLLNKTDIAFEDGDITLLHRDKLKLFYMSKEAAWADGYTDFNEDDLCPVTKRVYRLGGLRLESRKLLMQVRGMLPGPVEKRLRMVKLDPTGQNNPIDLAQLLDEAALVIPAFGYRPAVMPIYDATGAPVDLMCAQNRADSRMVDTECRVLDAAGAPLPNVYAIGFVTGYRLTGGLGGEPSYRGQNNGLWLYQNGVGEIIVNHLLT